MKLSVGIDEVAFARSLGMLLLRKKQMNRIMQRGRLSLFTRSSSPLIWGGTRGRYTFWWGTCVFASISLPCIAAVWFNSQGRPLPGGAFGLLLFLATIVAWPSYAFVKRARAIRGRRHIGTTALEAAEQNGAPAVPGEFAMAVRDALASAYCVPSELIGYADTRRAMKSLSLLSQPLAIEVIADVCQRRHVELDLDRACSAAEFFRTHQASTVAELARVLHGLIQSMPPVSPKEDEDREWGHH